MAVHLVWGRGRHQRLGGLALDLRTQRKDASRGDRSVRVVIPSDVAVALRSLLLLDTECERLVFRATPSEKGVVLAGDEDDFDELTGYVAAEANHEDDRRRRKLLDAAFAALTDALER